MLSHEVVRPKGFKKDDGAFEFKRVENEQRREEIRSQIEAIKIQDEMDDDIARLEGELRSRKTQKHVFQLNVELQNLEETPFRDSQREESPVDPSNSTGIKDKILEDVVKNDVGMRNKEEQDSLMNELESFLAKGKELDKRDLKTNVEVVLQNVHNEDDSVALDKTQINEIAQKVLKDESLSKQMFQIITDIVYEVLDKKETIDPDIEALIGKHTDQIQNMEELMKKLEDCQARQIANFDENAEEFSKYQESQSNHFSELHQQIQMLKASSSENETKDSRKRMEEIFHEMQRTDNKALRQDVRRLESRLSRHAEMLGDHQQHKGVVKKSMENIESKIKRQQLVFDADFATVKERFDSTHSIRGDVRKIRAEVDLLHEKIGDDIIKHEDMISSRIKELERMRIQEHESMKEMFDELKTEVCNLGHELKLAMSRIEKVELQVTAVRSTTDQVLQSPVMESSPSPEGDLSEWSDGCGPFPSAPIHAVPVTEPRRARKKNTKKQNRR